MSKRMFVKTYRSIMLTISPEFKTKEVWMDQAIRVLLKNVVKESDDPKQQEIIANDGVKAFFDKLDRGENDEIAAMEIAKDALIKIFGYDVKEYPNILSYTVRMSDWENYRNWKIYPFIMNRNY